MKSRLVELLKKYFRWQARRKLKAKPALWEQITLYMKKTKSTGVSWSDFWELYNAIRSQKPKEILECGPGASTMVMAFALMENEKEGYPGKITAMEEIQEYLDMSVELLPEFLKKYVVFQLSPRVDDTYEIFRGVRYRDVPRADYDFIFVDGPHHRSHNGDAFCFDFDFIHLLRNSTIPIAGIVDYRLSSSYVLQTLLGAEKVKFDLVKELAFIAPVTAADLRTLTLENNTRDLLRYGKVFGNSMLRLYASKN
jgi:hypothetical protein